MRHNKYVYTKIVLGNETITTSGFATTHVVVSVILSLINLPTPYQPPKYVKDSYWGE